MLTCLTMPMFSYDKNTPLPLSTEARKKAYRDMFLSNLKETQTGRKRGKQKSLDKRPPLPPSPSIHFNTPLGRESTP